MTKFCPNCETPNDDNAQFCMKCGYQFPQVAGQTYQSVSVPQQQYPPPQQQYPYYPIPKPRKTLWIPIIAAVVAAIVIVAVIAVVLLSSGPHFGFVSVSTVDKMTGETLTQSPVFSYVPGGYSAYITQGEKVYYNDSSGNSIRIAIVQFSSQLYASEYYNALKSSLNSMGIPYLTGNYSGFNYVYGYSNTVYGVSGGASGQYKSFVFSIIDYGITISNFNVFLQEQINAMT